MLCGLFSLTFLLFVVCFWYIWAGSKLSNFHLFKTYIVCLTRPSHAKFSYFIIYNIIFDIISSNQKQIIAAKSQNSLLTILISKLFFINTHTGDPFSQIANTKSTYCKLNCLVIKVHCLKQRPGYYNPSCRNFIKLMNSYQSFYLNIPLCYCSVLLNSDILTGIHLRSLDSDRQKCTSGRRILVHILIKVKIISKWTDNLIKILLHHNWPVNVRLNNKDIYF